LQQAEVVTGVLVVANENAAALAQPSQRSFHNPTPWFATTWATWSRFFTDGADVGYVAQGRGRFTTSGIVEPFVEQQMLFLIVGTFDNDGKQGVFKATRVMPIGRRGRDT